MATDPDSEMRVRAEVYAGRVPTHADVEALLMALDEARAEAADRWDAIGRLAPAAKRHRAQSQARGRVLDELRQHLEALDPSAGADAVEQWRERALSLLGGEETP